MSTESIPIGEYVPTADQRVVMYGLSWEDFEAFLALRGDELPRVTYLEGTLELMSPSRGHERIKIRLAAMIQHYLEVSSTHFDGVGSWLIKKAGKKAGAEPDDSYIIGNVEKNKPDLAVEVVWTSGGLEKLEVYRRLGIGEVWFWQDNRITFHVLSGDRYEERERSACIPAFDRKLAYELMELPSMLDVRRALRERLG